MREVPPGHYEALLHAGADVTLEVGQEPTAVQWITNNDVSTLSLAYVYVF